MKTEVIIQKIAEKDIRLYVDGVRYDAVSCMVCAVPELHVSYYWKNPTVDEKIYGKIDCDSVRFVDESGNIKEARDGMYDFPLSDVSRKPVEATKDVDPTVDTSEGLNTPRKTVSIHDTPHGLTVELKVDGVRTSLVFHVYEVTVYNESHDMTCLDMNGNWSAQFEGIDEIVTDCKTAYGTTYRTKHTLSGNR